MRWIEDEHAPACFACHAKFTLVHRRSHCRCCGKVFCKRPPCTQAWSLAALADAVRYDGPALGSAAATATLPVCARCIQWLATAAAALPPPPDIALQTLVELRAEVGEVVAALC